MGAEAFGSTELAEVGLKTKKSRIKEQNDKSVDLAPDGSKFKKQTY
jgi:hypothetical protein